MWISKPGISQPQQQPIKGYQQSGSFSKYLFTTCCALFDKVFFGSVVWFEVMA